MLVLIVEDEKRLADALVQILAKNKIQAEACYNGIDGLDNAMSGIYSVVVLDIMLPEMNGLEVLAELRKNKITTPVILLTAKDTIQDKVKGLDIGADDYLTKPFSTDELLARIRALDRRGGAEIIHDDIVTYDDLSLNTTTYELSCGANSVKLGLKEYLIMELLIKNGNHILTKENLLLKVWGYETDVEFNNVEVYVSFLRKKIKFIKSRVNIKTVRGVGYNLSCEE